MKKLLALALALSMTVALVACGSNTKETEKQTETQTTEAQTEEQTEGETAGESSDETPAQTILGLFETLANDGKEYTAFEMADALCLAAADAQFPLGLVCMEVEEGLLNGFGNNEITGFEEGAQFSPMIGTIPFMGFVFTLADGADAEAFTAMLEKEANLGWNICTQAEEMATKVVGNKVAFVMAPAAFEE